MKLKELTVTLKGPLWSLDAFEVEGIDVIKKWKEDDDKSEGSVTITDLEVTPDNLLDIFIKVGAPNGSIYQVVLSGQTDHTPAQTLAYTEKNLVVKKNGRLNIVISKDVTTIIQ